MSADLSSYGNVALPIIVNRSQPVGNQVIAESQTAANAAMRQAQQSVQATDWSFVHETDGDGVFTFTLNFDVAFTREPVFAHGMAFTEFAAAVRDDLETARVQLAAAQAAVQAQVGQAGSVKVLSQGTVGTSSAYDQVSGQEVPTTMWKAAVSGTAGAQYRAVVTADGKTFKTVPVTDGTMTLSYPTGAASTSWELQQYNQNAKIWQKPATSTVGNFGSVLQSKEYAAAVAKIKEKQEELANTLRIGADPDKIPLCSAYVKRWLIDTQGNYTGADMLIVVRTFKTVDDDPEPSSSDGPLG